MIKTAAARYLTTNKKKKISIALIVYFIDSLLIKKIAVRSLKILKLVSKVGGDRARQSS